jgi:ribose transport system substrate-binding protein
MNKRRGIVAAVAALAAALTGCSSSGSPASASGTTSGSAVGGKAVRVAFFNPAVTAYTTANQEGVKAAVEKLGGKLTVFDGAFDANKQLAQMQDAIASKQYDAFIVMPLNGTLLAKPAQEAIAAGIKVVADWNDLGTELDSIAPQVQGISSVVANKMGKDGQGQHLGEQIVAACAGIDPCNAVYMPGAFSQASEQVRLEAAKATVAKHGNIKLTVSADGKYSNSTAQTVATNELLAHPDTKVFATTDDGMLLGILAAVKDAGKTGKVALIGAGASKRVVSLIRQGQVTSSLVLLPVSEGAKSGENAVLAVQGKTVPTSIDSVSLSPIGPVATKESLGTAAGLKFTGEFDAS